MATLKGTLRPDEKEDSLAAETSKETAIELEKPDESAEADNSSQGRGFPLPNLSPSDIITP